MVGCLMAFAFAPGRVGRTAWKCRGVTKMSLMSEKICESRGDGIRHWRDECLTHDKGVWSGNVPMVKRVGSGKREWSEPSEPSVNRSSKTLKVERNWFTSSSGGWSQCPCGTRRTLRARLVCVLEEGLDGVVLDDVLGERQVVPVMDVRMSE